MTTILANIEITANHILCGRKLDCDRCPIAHAVTAATNYRVSVDEEYVTFYCGHRRVGQSPLPAKARRFVRDFDARRPRKPFSFELEVPAGEEA